MLGLKRVPYAKKDGKIGYAFKVDTFDPKAKDMLEIKHETINYEKDGQQKTFDKTYVEVEGIEIPVQVSVNVKEATGRQLIHNELGMRN